jgi:hypothetical protein
VSRGLEVVGCKTMGKEAKHLKLLLDDPQTANRADAVAIAPTKALDGVAFGFGDWCDRLPPGSKVDVVFNLDENVWQNKRTLQLKVKDMHVSE